jgi:predicted DNA-binding protein (MmcQ/YjbR family)
VDAMARRPKLPAVSGQMQAWSAALKAEIGDWPGVKLRSFFGFTALYRREKIFALLPSTRGLETANSLAFKLESSAPRVLAQLRQDPRIGSIQMSKTRWFTFELATDADLHDALDWLARAYNATSKVSIGKR